MTPRQEAAKIPFDLMCHDSEMKQESTVFQFHNMEILHGEAVSFGIEVADAPAEVVAAMPMLIISIISILSVPSVVLENECTVACTCENMLL